MYLNNNSLICLLLFYSYHNMDSVVDIFLRPLEKNNTHLRVKIDKISGQQEKPLTV